MNQGVEAERAREIDMLHRSVELGESASAEVKKIVAIQKGADRPFRTETSYGCRTHTSLYTQLRQAARHGEIVHSVRRHFVSGGVTLHQQNGGALVLQNRSSEHAKWGR